MPHVILHLVHGTWPEGGWLPHRFPWFRAREPRWFEDGSSFRRHLASLLPPTVAFVEHRWAGRNSMRARTEAARQLSERLTERVTEAPAGTRHLVIAHSHGGNVALWAVRQMPHTERQRISGLAALATPFLNFEPSASDSAETTHISIGCVASLLAFVVVSVGITLVVHGVGGSSDRDPPWYALLPGALAAIGAYVASVGRAIVRHEEIAQLVGLSVVPAPPLMAIRQPGDEASLLMATGDLASALLHRLWSGLLRAVNGWFGFALWLALLLGVEVMAFNINGRPLGLPAAVVATIPAGLLVLGVVGFSARLALALPIVLMFGPDSLSIALTARLGVEPAPREVPTELHILRPTERASRHSVTENPTCRLALATWIRSLAGAQR